MLALAGVLLGYAKFGNVIEIYLVAHTAAGFLQGTAELWVEGGHVDYERVHSPKMEALQRMNGLRKSWGIVIDRGLECPEREMHRAGSSWRSCFFSHCKVRRSRMTLNLVDLSAKVYLEEHLSLLTSYPRKNQSMTGSWKASHSSGQRVTI